MKGLTALALAYVLSQFYRSFLAVLTPQLTQELGADKADLSLASGLWFISFALMQFVVGVCLDRYGPKRTAGLIFGVASTGGALVFATAQSPGAIVLAMCLFGIGCSPVLMASLFIFARRYSSATFAIMTSWLVAFGNTGNVIGASPMASAVEMFGWRSTMLGLAAVTFIISVAILLFLTDPEQEHQQDAGWKGYLQLFKTPVLWAIMIMMLLTYAPVVNIRGLWAGPLLQDLYQSNSLQIGHITLFMAIAMIVGSVIYGPLDRMFNTRKWIIFTGNLFVLGALLIFTVMPDTSLLLVTVLFVVIGVFGTSYGVVMAHGRSFIPAHLTGRGVTLFNFCSMFGAGVMQFSSGRLMNTHPQPGSVQSYQWLFGFYALTLALALLVYLWSRDAQPHTETH